MNALVFLAAKQIKNFFFEILHRPSRLVLYLVCLALLVFTLAAPGSGRSGNDRADPRLLQGIYLGVLIFFGLLQILSSFKSGATFFRMYDVNFLFVSPISPKNILWYGMVRQAAATVLSLLFLLFYNGMLVEKFGISGAGTALLIAGLIFFMIFAQLLSLMLYSFLNGRSGRQRAAKAAIAAYFACMLLAGYAVFLRAGGGQEGLLTALASPELSYFPAFGWMTGAVFAVLRSDAPSAAVYFGLMLALTALCLILFVRSDPDYYEDVLQSAQTRFETMQAAKDRRYPGASSSLPGGKPADVGKSGLGRGWGASAFFFKHLREAKRRSRFVFVSFSTVLIFAGNVAAAFVMRSLQKGDPTAPSSEQMMFFLLGADVYILFLMNAAGDWSRELQKPYVYLVPEPPFQKLFWASLTTILKPVVDGALFFAAVCAVLGTAPAAGAACALLYASFGFLFTAGNVLSQRLFGSMSNRGITAVLYLFLLLLLMAPGIGLAFAVYSFAPAALSANMLLSGLTAAGWNAAVSLAIFFACRNLLSDAEMH